MGTLTLSAAAQNAMANAIADLCDAGSGAGYIEIRTGAAPASPDDAATGTLLATLPLSDPAFGDASAGVVTANAITADGSADASGTAGYGRVYDSDDNPIFDGDCTAVGGGGVFQLNAVAITAGGQVSCTSGSLTMPAS